jgi:cytochrome c-type biogenesis protein
MLIGAFGVHAPAVPVSVAVLAGALTTLNPCSFPLLPAFLSYYVGASEQHLPRARTSVLQGALVGLAVAAGCVALIGAVLVPLIYGATPVAHAIPMSGLVIGAGMSLAGLAVLARGHLSLPLPARLTPRRGRGPLTLFGFGAAYGLASLGCGLPVFLALVGATLATSGTGPALLVFVAYAAGMALMLVTFAIAAALVRDGLARQLRRLVPYLGRASGVLLLAAGLYLMYFWARVRFGSTATLADDPIVGATTRYSARVQTLAADLGLPVLVASAGVVTLLVAGSLARYERRARRGTPAALAPVASAPRPGKETRP